MHLLGLLPDDSDKNVFEIEIGVVPRVKNVVMIIKEIVRSSISTEIPEIDEHKII